MSAPVGRRSNLLLITLLLAISILLEQFFIAPIFPWLGNFGSIRPMIVFLDIPLELPAIDLIPVSILFALFYQIAPSAGLSREHPSISSGARVWKALTGWWTLLALLLAGGGCFHLAQDFLPRTVSNGIDSFGVRADLTLPYPSGDLIHLHGAVVMLLASAFGVLILHRRTAAPVPQQEAVEAAFTAQPQPVAASTIPQQRPEVLSSAVVSSTGNLIAPSINEVFAAQQQQTTQPQTTQQQHSRYQPAETTEVATVQAPPEKKYKPVTILPGNTKPAIITPEPAPTCRLTTPPPIAVVMPRRAPAVGKVHPCYVIGNLKPVKMP
ncbi:MAG TPA: hypothetical protein VGM89_13945 [Puia sp.]|jgi:hypothetical protein